MFLSVFPDTTASLGIHPHGTNTVALGFLGGGNQYIDIVYAECI